MADYNLHLGRIEEWLAEAENAESREEAIKVLNHVITEAQTAIDICNQDTQRGWFVGKAVDFVTGCVHYIPFGCITKHDALNQLKVACVRNESFVNSEVLLMDEKRYYKFLSLARCNIAIDNLNGVKTSVVDPGVLTDILRALKKQITKLQSELGLRYNEDAYLMAEML